MRINDLIKRNMPVFVVGAATFFIFAIIIFSAASRPNNGEARLIVIENEDLVAPHTYVKGPAGAKVTMIGFIDFSSEESKNSHQIAEQVYNKFSNYLRYGIVNYPLSNRKKAEDAAIAALAAGEQGKFWDYVNILLDFQNRFSRDDLINNADVIGLDTAKFENDLKSDVLKNVLQQDIKLSKKVGIKTAPAFFVNGKQIDVSSYSDLEYAVKRALREAGIDPDSIKTPDQIEEERKQTELIQKIIDFVDTDKGVVEISFDKENGFDPYNIRVSAGQLVRWTNNSEEDVSFKQLMPKYPSLMDKEITIEPGKTFEFRMKLRESGIWTYKDTISQKSGRVVIVRLPSDITDLLPEEV